MAGIAWILQIFYALIICSSGCEDALGKETGWDTLDMMDTCIISCSIGCKADYLWLRDAWDILDWVDNVDKVDNFYVTLLSHILEDARIPRICRGMVGIGMANSTMWIKRILWIEWTSNISHFYPTYWRIQDVQGWQVLSG